MAPAKRALIILRAVFDIDTLMSAQPIVRLLELTVKRAPFVPFVGQRRKQLHGAHHLVRGISGRLCRMQRLSSRVTSKSVFQHTQFFPRMIFHSAS